MGYPFLHRPSGLLPSDPHRKTLGVKSAVQSSAAFTGQSTFFLPLLHASSGVFISGLNMFSQICLEFSWNTNSVTGGAVSVGSAQRVGSECPELSAPLRPGDRVVEFILFFAHGWHSWSQRLSFPFDPP